MRVVITGGNGYIGARLSLFLANNGYEVIPICYPSIPEDEDWVQSMYTVLSGDLRKNELVDQIKELHLDIIIHLVSLDHKDSENSPEIVSEINVLPTWKLLDTFAKTGL